MDWKTDSTGNDTEVESYSSFQSNKSGKWIDRMELPIILIGAGLLALVILFVLFIPKKNEFTTDDYRHLASRINQLEARITDLSGKEIDISEFDPSKNPVQYQQVINWIKSNAEVISETIKKIDGIEAELKTLQSTAVQKSVKAPAPPVAVKKQIPPEVIKSAPASPPKSETVTVVKSQPVSVAPAEKSTMVVAAPKEDTVKLDPEKAKEVPPKPVVEKESIEQPPPPEIPAKPVAKKSETVKYIFHRVEKGETLYRISRNYGLTVEKLQELNNMKKDDLLISVGQELIVRVEKQ